MNYMIWIWLGAVILFGAVEAMTAGLVSIWFVAGALAALAAALLDASVLIQLCCLWRCPPRRWPSRGRW